jgi:hypothetical protein
MTSVLRASKWQNAAGTTRGAVINTYQVTSGTQASYGGGSGENRGATWYDLNNMSITLTPVSSTSRFLRLGRVMLSAGTADNYNKHIRHTRSGTAIGKGVNGVYTWAAHAQSRTFNGAGVTEFIPIHYLDSPATTSSITYKVQGLQTNYGNALYMNRVPETNWQSANLSTFTVMEIQA